MKKGLLLYFLTMCIICLRAESYQKNALAQQCELLIIIDIRQMSLTLYENQKAIKRYPVAVGTHQMPSPLGLFHITHRFMPDPSGFGTRFLGLDVPWGNYGIHGTNKPSSIGSNASHGCIRMLSKDAEELYRLVPNGTSVLIESGAYGELGGELRTLLPGDRNAQVRVVQRKLRALGYYEGNLDGVYGAGTSAALRRFQKAAGLSPSDFVDETIYHALGILLFE